MRRKLTGDYVVQCYVLEGNGNPGNLGRLICYCQWKELVQLRMPTETRRETEIERDRATALLNAGLYMAKTSCFSLLASRKAKMLKKETKTGPINSLYLPQINFSQKHGYHRATA